MNDLDAKDLAALARVELAPCVSIFQPRLGRGRADRQDRVRFDNLARVARAELVGRGLGEREADALLAPVLRLAEEPELWTGGPGGVAFYAGAGFARPVETDFALPERVEVGDRFVLRPLLPLAERAAPFYVLALSLNQVRLLAAGARGSERLRPAALPASFDAEMGYAQYESAVSAHSSSPAALGRRSAIFHGHGDDDEEHLKEDIRHFVQRVAAVLEAELRDPEAPLVLAAVESLHAHFGAASRRLRLVAPGLVGNPETLADAELAERARALVGAARRRARREELARWLELRGTGRVAEGLGAILPAADQARIQALLVPLEGEVWGRYDAARARVVAHARRQPGDVELLERAVCATLARGGEVHALPAAELPRGSAVALLRWAAA